MLSGPCRHAGQGDVWDLFGDVFFDFVEIEGVHGGCEGQDKVERREL